ncbi:hypothetical protein [Terribacillus halophilus]|uniref:hypothetical protein n=1 Tax=Terribacillus halophilus TaxID=361279 RepID=UPI0009873AAB|nr:hypothetical protein [Terribacillus halophilus]
MANIIDMDQVRTKKRMLQFARPKGIEYEIYLTVVKYVDKHARPDSTKETIMTTSSDLAKVYNGDRKLFKASYYELLSYWKIALLDEEFPTDKEFEQFPKLGDLCSFIDRKVQQDKYTS